MSNNSAKLGIVVRVGGSHVLDPPGRARAIFRANEIFVQFSLNLFHYLLNYKVMTSDINELYPFCQDIREYSIRINAEEFQ